MSACNAGLRCSEILRQGRLHQREGPLGLPPGHAVDEGIDPFKLTTERAISRGARARSPPAPGPLGHAQADVSASSGPSQQDSPRPGPMRNWWRKRKVLAVLMRSCADPIWGAVPSARGSLSRPRAPPAPHYPRRRAFKVPGRPEAPPHRPKPAVFSRKRPASRRAAAVAGPGIRLRARGIGRSRRAQSGGRGLLEGPSKQDRSSPHVLTRAERVSRVGVRSSPSRRRARAGQGKTRTSARAGDPSARGQWAGDHRAHQPARASGGDPGTRHDQGHVQRAS